jgi:membrane protein YdbS with pleckstrin-like domain
MAGKLDGPEKEASVVNVPWSEGAYSGKALRMRALMIGLVTIVFVAIAVYISLNDKLPERYSVYMWAVMLGIPLLLWIQHAIIYFYRTWTIRYRLTTHRFFHERGLIRRTTDVIEVIDISDMKMEQTLWDRYINGGVATIILESSDDSHPNLVIDGLEEPKKVFDSIDEIRRVQREQRGLKSI